jgi:cytochrome oxidase Cu insertion factor (SCO1/SenC/PrrC family)
MKLASLGILAATALALAQEHVATGPDVGTPIPAFELPDQNGRKQTLSSLAGPKGALLVFFRSADW